MQSLISKSHLETNEGEGNTSSSPFSPEKKTNAVRPAAWAAYWSPIFQSLTTQCINPCREIRQQAFSSLQRSLLSPELAASDHTEWTAIFGEVLFPLIVRLLKPEVYQSDSRGMGETRVRAATLLCRIFLHYLVLLSEWEGMLDLWLRILDLMDRLLNSGQGDLLVCFCWPPFFRLLSSLNNDTVKGRRLICKYRKKPSPKASRISSSSCPAAATSPPRPRVRRKTGSGQRLGND